MRERSCCFFGHRTIEEEKELKESLFKTIEDVIKENGIRIFYFGSKSAFDDLCYQVVSELKNKYFDIERVYVRSKDAQISESYERYLLQSYERTYFPRRISRAGKAAYVERNYEMIDQSMMCIIYLDDTYLPPQRRQGIHLKQAKSGTKIAYEYAKKKFRKIINMYH